MDTYQKWLRAPTIECEEAKGRFTFYCQYCNEKHDHPSVRAGQWFKAKCIWHKSPYLESGYVLTVLYKPTEQELKDRKDYESHGYNGESIDTIQAAYRICNVLGLEPHGFIPGAQVRFGSSLLSFQSNEDIIQFERRLRRLLQEISKGNW